VVLASVCLVTVATAVVLAHEGHAPLPTRGAAVDVERGQLVLTAEARTSIDVETVPVEVRTLEERLPAAATVGALWQGRAFAASKLPGRIVRAKVTPGQTVTAGETIAEIESLEIDTLQRDVLAARNDITLSEKLVAELTKSSDAGAIPGQSVLEAEAKLARGKNTLDLTRAKWLGLGLSAARFDELLRRGEALPDLTLPVAAPIGGTVVTAVLPTGKVIEPSEHLAEIIDLSTVWVGIEVLEKDLHRVAVGQSVELHLNAYPGEVFRPAIRAKGQFLDPVTNVTTAWTELTNPRGKEPRFQPGMSGLAQLITSEDAPSLAAVSARPARKSRPTVPVEAVLREGVERFVLVEEANAAGSSEYRKVPVVVGREAAGRVELLAGGVFSGDRVVTRGGHELAPFFAPNVLRPSAEAVRTIGLAVEPARLVALDEILTLDGAADIPPARRGFAASQLAGIVQTIHVDRGQVVAAGDVLAEVFSPDLLTAQQELLRVHLETALATETLDRLRKAGGGAARRLWELESQLTGLKTQSDALRRKLITVGLTTAQIDRLLADKRLVALAPVRASFAGVVVNFDKVLGQAVAAHESLFEVRDESRRVPIRGLVPERDAPRVKTSQSARIRFVADPNIVGTGRVVRSDRTFGADNRTQSVWVELDADWPRPLLHGQRARLTVVLGHRPQTLAVPLSAVAGEGAESFVFIRKSDGTFTRRRVETGPADDRFVTVTRGLSAGEMVAVAGVHELMTAFASLR
jgi:RND family efflux transporter MFP subunit